MLNKILEYEKDALKDKIHEGVSIGIAIDNHDQIKMRCAYIDPNVKNDKTVYCDFLKDKYMINPGVHPPYPVKRIYSQIHDKIIRDVEMEAEILTTLLGPAKAPGQVYKVHDYRVITVEDDPGIFNYSYSPFIF